LWPRLQEEISLAHRKGQFLSVIYFGLDDFDDWRARLGPQRADAALRELGARLAKQSRGSDAYFRYGPHEFVAVLPATHLAGARVSAERIRQAIYDRPFLHGTVSLSASFGLATYPLNGTTERALVESAAEAYHRAARSGKNQLRM